MASPAAAGPSPLGTDLLLRSMMLAAQKAGMKIRNHVLGKEEVGMKTKSNSSDLVTDLDVECQETIVRVLKQTFPQHKIIGEESEDGTGFTLTDEETFIIDPIDGTSNFAKRVPHCAVLIARSKNKIIDRALILDPLHLEVFSAMLGKGAFLARLRLSDLGEINGSSVRLSVNANIKSLREATVQTDIGYVRDALGVTEFTELQNQLLHAKSCRTLRVTGSCGLGLAWVACGRADAYVQSNGPMIWDFCGGALMVREAGGVTTDPSGAPFDMTKRSILAASSPELAREITGCVDTANRIASVLVKERSKM